MWYIPGLSTPWFYLLHNGEFLFIDPFCNYISELWRATATLLHPIGNQDPIPCSQSSCQLWLEQKLHNMMFTIFSCLIAALQDKVHWIEGLSLAEKTAISTWEVFAKSKRSFTLTNDNSLCYNKLQEQSVESFMAPTHWKCHNTTVVPVALHGAVGYRSMWIRSSGILYFPANLFWVEGWNAQCRLVVMALGHSPAKSILFSSLIS